jgi:SAM-dependent methyltransferase
MSEERNITYNDPGFWQERIKQNHGNLMESVQNGVDWEETERGHKKIMNILLGRVLDLGCGYGRAILLLPETVTDYVGIDVCPEFIKEARKSFPDKKFILGDVRKENFKDKEFDWCLMIGIHNDEARSVARRVARKTLLLWLSKPDDYEIMEGDKI